MQKVDLQCHWPRGLPQDAAQQDSCLFAKTTSKKEEEEKVGEGEEPQREISLSKNCHQPHLAVAKASRNAATASSSAPATATAPAPTALSLTALRLSQIEFFYAKYSESQRPVRPNCCVTQMFLSFTVKIIILPTLYGILKNNIIPQLLPQQGLP